MFAAAGYARATGKIGVALVTSGPGALNAINALASAHLEGLPVLLLAGEAPRARFGNGALQEGSSYGLDIVHMARPITKLAVELLSPNAAIPQLAAVIAAMKRDRMGAGLLTCPVDLSQRCAKPTYVGMPDARPPLLDEDALDRAAALLDGAKRIAIYAGNGVRSGDGPAALRALAERLQAPVITTPHGKGVFPDSHPLALGVFGWGFHTSAVEYLKAGVDCLLVVGSSLSEVASNSWSPFLSQATNIIQIDVSSASIGRSIHVDVAVIGGAAPAMRSIGNRLAPRAKATFGIERHSNPEVFLVGPEGRITPQRALWELQQMMPQDTWFTCDLGEHMQFAFHYMQIDTPAAFTIQLGLCSMASGIATAVGVSMGRHGEPVAAITGDGCLLMGPGPIAAAARHRLPILFVVLNDQRLAMCELGHATVYEESPPYPIEIDVVKIAEGLGARALTVSQPNEILNLDPAELLANGPCVLDVRIDTKE